MQIRLPGSPSDVACLLIRVSFGLSLMFIAIAHIIDHASFTLSVGDGFEGFVFLSFPAFLWSYAHPALLLFGGSLLVINKFPVLAAWSAGLPLAMIPAGMLSKAIFALDLNDLMPSAINTWIWILVYVYVVKNCLATEEQHPLQHHHAAAPTRMG